MKYLLLFFLMSNVWAVPVVNKNMAAEGTFVTIWPDHKDPDHFYFAPNFMKVSVDENKVAKFHFTRYTTGSCGRFGSTLGSCKRKGLLTTLFKAGYEMEQLQIAQAKCFSQ